MAIVNAIAIGLKMTSDVGIGPAIVRSERGQEPRFLNTAWTIQIGRSLLIIAVTLALAGPVAHWYNEPELIGLLPLIGIANLIRGFQTTAIFTAQRRVAFDRVVVIEIVAALLAAAATVLLVVASRTVWSLAWGAVVGSAISVTIHHLYLPSHRHRLAFDRSAIGELLRFGQWIFLSTIFAYCGTFGIRLALPAVESVSALAMYTIAATLAVIPAALANSVAQRVMVPIYAELSLSKAGDDRLAEAMGAFARKSAPAFFGCLIAITIGTPVIRILYDDRYDDAALVIPILGLRSAAMFMQAVSLGLFVGLGRPWIEAGIGGLRVVASLASALWLARDFGLLGFAAGIAIAEFFILVVQRRVVVRHLGIRRVPSDRRMLFATFAACALAFVAAV